MLKYSISAAALAAGLALSACSGGGGGGGIGSPGGSAPGTGSGNTPAPTPAPTPTPTPNTSLLALNSSETFTADGATGTASFPANGTAITSAAATASISIAYDATARSYTITSGTRSQTFRPSDADASVSAAPLAIYKRVSGTVTDTLTLTAAGTSGTYTYQYVGAGYWQRTDQRSDATSGTIDAFTYGIRTPASAMPRTGSAVYLVDLMGVEANPGSLTSITASGRLTADFAAGGVTFGGFGKTAGSPTNNFSFNGNATLTSGTSGFTGTMTGGTFPATGTVSGNFFGPAADEVGATFALTNASVGRSVVGTLTGRKSLIGVLETLAQVTGARAFDGLTAQTSWDVQTTAGTVQPGTSISGFASGALALDRTNGSYTYAGRTFTAANAISDTSNYRAFRQIDGDRQYTLRTYVPSTAAGQLEYTYSSFAEYEMRYQPTNGTSQSYEKSWAVYGIETPASALPRSGTGRYSAKVFGNAVRPGANEAYTMTGLGNWVVAFDQQTVTGSLNLTFAAITGGQPFGDTMNLQGQLIQNAVGFAGTLTSPGGGTGKFRGSFYGPTAEESSLSFAGTFGTTGGRADGLKVTGVALGHQ
jgi:hypothetical protein